MSSYLPYTYLIGWSDHNKWYYGVRYSKKCNPNDLWKKYFTSSKIVKAFAKKHGRPDVIQIRKTFNDGKSAVLWEQKVLKRMNVEKDSKFLNCRNITTKAIITKSNSGSFIKGNIPYNKGLNLKNILSKEERKKYGRVFSNKEKEHLQKINTEKFKDENLIKQFREKALEQYKDFNFKQKHIDACKQNPSGKDKIWINDGIKNKRINTKDKYKYPEWNIGRYIPAETINKMTANRLSTRDPKTGRFIKEVY
jgi:hypothetical protein